MPMTRLSTIAALSLALAATPVAAQRSFDDVEIRTEQLAPGVAVLFGRGGTIGVSWGEDGTVLIDDQFAPLTERVQAAIASLGAEPVRFLINTHWHWDHTGGNENFGEAGALILAHENVRIRQAAGSDMEGREVPPAPPVALPVITYEDGITLHLNGDTVRVIHTHNGHTDGDSIVWWENANVVHMGDLFFNGGTFPFVDRASGGAVQGMIHALTRVIDMTNDETRVIAGHGPVGSRADLIGYRDMITALTSQVASAIETGRTLAEIQTMNFPADYASLEGGFISGEEFIAAVYDSLTDPDAMAHTHDHGPDHDDGDDIH
jgi:glyoxylase-like metal-dependent hydrolase (beta-lactamase superfamily II)